ncbi:MAG: addiction module protein [Gemmataceae bacterium]
MPPTLESLGIDRLSVDDQLALMEAIWENVSKHPEQLPVSAALKKELDRRIADLDSHPENVLTWAEIKARVREGR